MPATIRVAEHAGACYGVNRALELARRCALEHAEPVHTLGPLIHNPIVVEELAEQGARTSKKFIRPHRTLFTKATTSSS